MRIYKQANILLGSALVLMLILIRVHDMRPLLVHDHSSENTAPLTTECGHHGDSEESEHQNSAEQDNHSNHSADCFASCPCGAHVLQLMSDKGQPLTGFENPRTSVWIGEDREPVKVIREPVERPPQA